MEIRVLGPLEVVAGPNSLDLGGPRQRTVLARLALNARHEVSVDALIEAVWGEHPPTAALKTLRGYVSRLRRTFAGTPIRIDRTSMGYALAIPAGCIDAERFTGAALAPDDDPAELVRDLTAALELWRGEPWAAFADEPAFRPEAERLLELKGLVWERLFEAELAMGSLEGLVADLKVAAAAFPYRERLRGQLARALYATGRQVDALNVLRASGTFLREELGLDPSPELAEIERLILCHDPSLRRAGPPVVVELVVLICEIVGSTSVARSAGAHWSALRVQFSELLTRTARLERGTVLGETGAGMVFGFQLVDSAVAAAVAAQRALRLERWPEAIDPPCRMGIHVGPVEQVGRHHHALTIEETARITEMAGPRQVVMSGQAAALFHDIVLDARLRPLGTFAIPDLPDPIELHLVDADGVDAEAAGPWRQLRLGDRRLIGREPAVERLRELLQTSRIVTVLGPGGSGKSSLAAETAAGMPGEVAAVELATATDLASAVTQMADAIRAAGPGTPLERILEHLGHRRFLLVLDNCEQILGAAATTCDQIIGRCPNVTILVTSREPLRVRAERAWWIPRLALPAAVELFVERARSSRADFEPSADEYVVIEHVCERLERLPLAIELAAARVRSLGVHDIADRLVDLMGLLVGDGADRPTRHQTMRAAIDWSVAQLSEVEQRLLDELAVFAGGAGLDAIERTSSVPDVTGALDGLVSRSLVDFDAGTMTVATRRDPRYLVLEPIRQYVMGALESDVAAQLSDAHAAWVMAMAQHASRGLDADPALWIARLDAETANVSRAFRYLLDARRLPDCMRIVANLGPYWYRRISADGRRMAMEVLAAASGDEPARLRAGVLLSAALLAEQTSSLPEALEHLTEAVGLLGSGDRSLRLAWALFHQGRVLAMSARAHADRPLRRALALFRECGEPSGEAWCALWLAQITEDVVRLHWISEVMRVGRDPRGRPMVAAALFHFAGPDALARGDRELAILHYDEAVELCRRSGDRSNELATRLGATLGFLEHDETDAAVRYVDDAAPSVAVYGTSYQRRLLSLLVADVARRCNDEPTASRLRAGARAGTAVFDGEPLERSTPHVQAVAALVARLPAHDHVDPPTPEQAFDDAIRWVRARRTGLDGGGSLGQPA